MYWHPAVSLCRLLGTISHHASLEIRLSHLRNAAYHIVKSLGRSVLADQEAVKTLPRFEGLEDQSYRRYICDLLQALDFQEHSSALEAGALHSYYICMFDYFLHIACPRIGIIQTG